MESVAIDKVSPSSNLDFNHLHYTIATVFKFIYLGYVEIKTKSAKKGIIAMKKIHRSAGIMNIKIAHRAMALKPSPTLAVSSLANKMRSEGVDVINFGVGEPDFETPQNIKNAAIKAIEDNFTRYTNTTGILELRQAICKKFKRDNGLNYTPQNILVSPGAKAALVNALLATCDLRDEVLIPAPFWVSYVSMVELVDAGTMAHTESN